MPSKKEKKGRGDGEEWDESKNVGRNASAAGAGMSPVSHVNLIS